MAATTPAAGWGFEHFAHGADIGVRGSGPTPAVAFAEAARALTAVVCDPETIAACDTVEIVCVAPDLEVLLVDFLNAVIYAMATHAMLFSRFEVTIAETTSAGIAMSDWRLQARAHGEPIDPLRHALAVEVKGATFTELRVGPRPDGGWLAQCVVDV
jgi:SHS2 domain-containing protein